MRSRRALLLPLLAACNPLTTFTGGDGPGGKADDPTDAPFGLDRRPENPTCVAPDRPPTGSNVRARRAFPNISFNLPIAMLQAPGDDSDWYVVEKRGVVWRFPNRESVTAADAKVFIDIRDRVNSTPNEAGLLGMAFHPGFADNGKVYLSYTRTSQSQLFSLVSEFRSADNNASLDPSTERLVLFVQQPFENHNGGGIAFGPDDLLYIGFGDGGFANDPRGNGQNTNTRLGALLRIDVDADPFAVPADNPFAQGGGGLPEIYAWGLRNPWRFSFDQATGELWLADVGQDELEEVNKIVRGGNYGWNLKEASDCFAAPSPCDDLDVIDPVAEYDHSAGDRSITGGFVYRGSEIGSLVGSYVYGDFVSGRIWGLFPGESGLEPQLLLESGVNITSFAQGADGEIYFLSFGDGAVSKLISAGSEPDTFPRLLSETGCFDPADPTSVAGGVIPYSVNAPLWSDGADKERFLAIPDGARIRVERDGDMTFPIGSVLIKTFYVGARRVETRLLVRHDDGGWAGYTYEWNDDQTDATLLQAGKRVAVGATEWAIPSRADCMACHTAAAGRSLGLEIAQLNGKAVYPSTNRSSNQLATLDHIDMLEGAAIDPDRLPALAKLADPDAPAADKARAYLHSNCSHCHRPGGPGRSDADLRWFVPLADAGVCNTEPIGGQLGIPDARLLAPGEPERSLLAARMKTLSPAVRMPPLGTEQVHRGGVEIVEAWIDGVARCP